MEKYRIVKTEENWVITATVVYNEEKVEIPKEDTKKAKKTA